MSQPLSPGSQLERGLKSLQRIGSTGVMSKDALDTAQKDLVAEFTKRIFENEQSLTPPPSIPPTVPSYNTSTQESVETPTADLDPVEREAVETLQTGFGSSTVPKVPKPRAPKQPWIGLQYNFETKKDAGGYLSSLGLQTKWAAKVVIGGRGAPVGRKYSCTAHADCAYRIRIRPPRVRTLCIQSHFLCS
jgi:hypothetical protein